jgi:prevent-host-death family protein
MKIAPLAEVKAQFSRYVEECERGPIVVTRNGRAVAVIVAAGDEDELERLVLAHTPSLRRLLQAAEARIRRSGGLSHEEFWSEAARERGSSGQRTSATGRSRAHPKK